MPSRCAKSSSSDDSPVSSRDRARDVVASASAMKSAIVPSFSARQPVRSGAFCQSGSAAAARGLLSSPCRPIGPGSARRVFGRVFVCARMCAAVAVSQRSLVQNFKSFEAWAVAMELRKAEDELRQLSQCYNVLRKKRPRFSSSNGDPSGLDLPVVAEALPSLKDLRSGFKDEDLFPKVEEEATGDVGSNVPEQQEENGTVKMADTSNAY
ncbi:hypothetical protein THAOC_14408, partial [Thalassiosira oceanica]